MTSARDGRTALYRLYDADGRLLYVGITSSPSQRWQRHAHGKTWWHLVADKKVEWFLTRERALAAETMASATEHPIYDRSSRFGGRWWDVPCSDFDDAALCADALVRLRKDLEGGAFPPGTYLAPAKVARAYGSTAAAFSQAMYALYREGALERRGNCYGVPK
jgi:predicted GIY-YIG superfamily endonuclease